MSFGPETNCVPVKMFGVLTEPVQKIPPDAKISPSNHTLDTGHVPKKSPKTRTKNEFSDKLWRKRWDSNPRDLAIYLISSQARYDHFDTLPYINFSSTGGARKRPRFDTLPCYPPRFPRGHELFYFIPRRLSSVFTLFLSARVPFFRFSPAPDGLTNIFQNFFVTLLD